MITRLVRRSSGSMCRKTIDLRSGYVVESATLREYENVCDVAVDTNDLVHVVKVVNKRKRWGRRVFVRASFIDLDSRHAAFVLFDDVLGREWQQTRSVSNIPIEFTPVLISGLSPGSDYIDVSVSEIYTMTGYVNCIDARREQCRIRINVKDAPLPSR